MTPSRKTASASPSSKLADAKAAVEAASAAFPAWSKTGPNKRRTLLLKAADAPASKVDEFTRLTIEVNGRDGALAGFNLNLGGEHAARGRRHDYADITGEIIPRTSRDDVDGNPQAAGVCVGIAPWNAPVILGTRAVAMPIACGNTVVLKASECVPARTG